MSLLLASLYVGVHPIGARAAASGAVTLGPASLAGGDRVAPGDWISAGYALAFVPDHARATVHVIGARASISLSCKQNGAPAGQMDVSLGDGPYTIAAGDEGWHATPNAQDPAGYQGGGAVPDLCGDKPMWVDTHASPGVRYSATLESTDTWDPIAIRFHAVDANAGCADPRQNPSPGSTGCAAAWSASVTVTAAVFAGSGPGTGPPGSGAGPTPSAATGSPATSPSSGRAPAGSAQAPGTGGPQRHMVSAARVTVATATASAAGGTSMRQPRGLPLSVVLAPAAGARHSTPRLPAGVAGSWLAELPVTWFALVAGIDLLLAVALVIRRRRTPRGIAT